MTSDVTPADLARYRRNLQGEVDGSFLYRTLAELQARPELADVFHRLADMEERHAHLWAGRLRESGATVAQPSPTARARLLAWLAHRLGSGFLVSLMARSEQASRTMYDDQPEAAGTGLPRDERSHARTLRLITRGGIEGGALARLEGRHRFWGGNALRAAVLGANDGLVSNLTLVMGVAGAAFSESAILIAGLAGLLAGAGSMALGEWISVQSSRELYQRELATEAEEIEEFPAEEEEELSLIYQAKGLPETQARAFAAAMMEDPKVALDAMAREELGIDPAELGGSPWTAALASFAFFALGALIPVLPFFFLGQTAAILVSLASGAVGLLLLGAGISLITGVGLLRAGARQMAFGLAAAAITFGIGRWLGVALGG
ncbi:MAG: VIT1/CCC1 transporter family protein [Acidimicrobiia bacterium]